MTIREYIIEKETAHAMERLEAFQAMGAPSIIIQGLTNEINILKSGNIKIGGNIALLNSTFNERQVKKGNGGKVYIQFDGKVNYFPNAKYGRYIAEAGGR